MGGSDFYWKGILSSCGWIHNGLAGSSFVFHFMLIMVNPGDDGLDKLLNIDGFGHELKNFRLGCVSGMYFLFLPGGNHDFGGSRGKLAGFIEQMDPVHIGKFIIGDDHGTHQAVLEKVQGCGPFSNHTDIDTPAGQGLLIEVPAGNLVLNHQNGRCLVHGPLSVCLTWKFRVNLL